MAKCLEIKRIKNADYSHIRQATDNFKKPMIYSLTAEEIFRFEKLKKVLIDYQENYVKLQNNYDLQELKKHIKDYSDDNWNEYKDNFVIFLTKDKIISQDSFRLDEYTSTVESVAEWFFTNSVFQEKFADSSLIEKLIIFTGFRKGIFGKFSFDNLSNLVNINSWYSDGNTNTFIHADHGLSNLFMQLEGTKCWWLASQFQNKDIVRKLFNSDSRSLDLSSSMFDDFEYYNIELQPGEILYIPTNWLHGVFAPQGLNLSLSFRFPITLPEMFKNMLYWQSMGVPLNNTRNSNKKDNKTLAESREEQAEEFNQVKFYLRKHQFSNRKILENEPEVVSGLYDLDQLNKAITGAN
jgi:hypothetical protein